MGNPQKARQQAGFLKGKPCEKGKDKDGSYSVLSTGRPPGRIIHWLSTRKWG